MNLLQTIRNRVMPMSSKPPTGDYDWAFDLISEAGQTRLFETFGGQYPNRKDALIVDFLTRWLRLPAAAGITTWVPPMNAPVPMDGRVTPLTDQGYRRIWDLMRRRSQREYQGDVERAVQESVKEMAMLLGYV